MQLQYFQQRNHLSSSIKKQSNELLIPSLKKTSKSFNLNSLSQSNTPRQSISNYHKYPLNSNLLIQSSIYQKTKEKSYPRYSLNEYHKAPQIQPNHQQLNYLNSNKKINSELYSPYMNKHVRSKSTNLNGQNALINSNKQRNHQTHKKISQQISNFDFQYKYRLQKSHRRGMIEQTKRAVQQFNQNNLQLLNKIKKFRNEFSRRTSPLKKIQKSPNKFNQVQYTLSTNYTQPQDNTISPQQISNIFKTNKQLKSFNLIENQISDQSFIILKQIGVGTFANVFMARHKKTGFLVTLKKIKKSILKNIKCQQQLITEIKIQMFVDHPNVIKIFGFYNDAQTITLILQFMQEGNLYKKLKSQNIFSEEQASQAISEILFAIEYLHENNIVHRDIKPQNVVLSNNVHKLCDFGTAAVCLERRSTVCGTLDYSAPQVILGHQYNAALDIWSLGVLTYELLTGKPPFYHTKKKHTIKQIMEYKDGEVIYPSNLSLESVHFISKFLIKNPDKRISIKDALKHKFIKIHMDQQTAQLRQKYKLNFN